MRTIKIAPKSAKTDNEIAPRTLSWETLLIQVGNVSQCSKTAKVNSPSERAIAKKIAPFTAMGTPVQLIKAFGDRQGFEQAVQELQSAIYQETA